MQFQEINPVEYFASRKLVTTDTVKIDKTSNDTYVQVLLILAPAMESGVRICSHFTPGCAGGCLITGYRLAHHRAVRARILRTRLFLENRPKFLEYYERDMGKLRKRCHVADKILVQRPNGMSDLSWEKIPGFVFHASDDFADYTKNPARYRRYLAHKNGVADAESWPHNYHLTFSRSETNEAACDRFLSDGGTATVVVRNKAVRAEMLDRGYRGFPCVDGDVSDRRWEDPAGHWVVLIAKGRAKKDRTGFVLDAKGLWA